MFYRPTSTKLVKSLDFWSQRNAVNSVLLLNQPRTYFFFHLWRFILQREEAVDKSLLQVFRWHSTDRLRMGQHKTTANINAGTVGCITTHLKNSFFHPEILFQQRKINVISFHFILFLLIYLYHISVYYYQFISWLGIAVYSLTAVRAVTQTGLPDGRVVSKMSAVDSLWVWLYMSNRSGAYG